MLKPAYALAGSDLFLQLQALGQLLAEAGPGVNRVNFEGEEATLAQVLDELRTFSLFGDSKVVVVRDAAPFLKEHRESLEDYLSTSKGGGTLVLRLDALPATQRIHKLIAKIGKVVDCNPPRDLVGWAVAHAKDAHQVALARDAAQQLVALVGGSLGRMDGEIAKLALTRTAIDLAAVNSEVAFQRDQEMHELTSELAAGDVAKALGRWRQLVQLDSSAEYRAVTWLSLWLEDVRMCLTSPAAFARIAWKYKGDMMKKFQATARALGRAKVDHLFDALARIDWQSKSGVGDMAGNVERFLLSIAAGA